MVAAEAALAAALAASRTADGPSEAGCLCKLEAATAAAGAGARAMASVPPRAARWFVGQFAPESPVRSAPKKHRRGSSLAQLLLGGGGGSRRTHPDGALALAAADIRTRPHAAYLALMQLLLVDHKFGGVAAHAWASALHAHWLELLHPRPSRAGAAAHGVTSGDAAPPFDACFERTSTCGEERGGGASRHAVARLREMVRTGLSSTSYYVGQSIGQLPAMPELPKIEIPTYVHDLVPDVQTPQRVRERVRGWWRRGRGKGAKE